MTKAQKFFEDIETIIPKQKEAAVNVLKTHGVNDPEEVLEELIRAVHGVGGVR